MKQSPASLSNGPAIRSGTFRAACRSACIAIVFAAVRLPAQVDHAVTLSELTKLTLAELMDIPVTSVSRGPEPLFHTAAAVTVITQDDIRRSGAANIPDALRLAPGLQVARVDSHTWAISSRGFNDVFANKLLVMIDGRTVYTPLFSGVFWDVQDTMLEDIDRIEVIRGPGATLWGANAVNGVINIITRHSRDTQGLLVSGGGGTLERGFGSVRYGVQINEETHFRLYGKYFDRDDLPRFPANGSANDDWQMGRGGFRLDWEPGYVNQFTFQGDFYGGQLGQTFTVPTVTPPFVGIVQDRIRVDGGNLLGRWRHEVSETSAFTFQTYFDWTRRRTAILGEERETADVDFQHNFLLGERHQMIWGLGFRRTQDRITNSPPAMPKIALFPQRRTDDLFSAFVQDEITLWPENLRLTLGSKFEHNDYTGFEVQPGARLLWTRWERHTLWASVARAVRTPSRGESDIRLNPPTPGVPPGMATIFGNPDFKSEGLIAYELGYRLQPHARVTLDLAGFYNVYDNLRSLRPAPFPQQQIANEMNGETYGAEVEAKVELAKPWHLHAGYTFLRMQLHNGAPGIVRPSTSSELFERLSPRHQFFAKSSLNIGRNVEFDTVARYVDRLMFPAMAGPGFTEVPGYVTMDLRLAWRFHENAELALVGQNLFERRHVEFLPTTIVTQAAEVPRSFYVKLTLQF